MAREFDASCALRSDPPAPQLRARLIDDATFGLARKQPDLSAHVVVTRPQTIVLVLLALGTAAAFAVWPQSIWGQTSIALSMSFLAGVLFRGWLAWIGGRKRPGAAPAADGNDLPLYTIFVPLFGEANVLPRLLRALLLLDYPHDRLQILLIVEEEDAETRIAAAAMAGRGPITVICVPQGQPQTKPRALNYALHFARGEFAVIYDAEDRPERDQLRKAVAAFGDGDARLICLQARLNFYNARENWLTGLFALDYALWFDVMLPGLERLGVPMPLGGTSNHFRTAELRALGGWDPFNVTEDADLGIRIAQRGRRVAMLDSTTFEEAPNRFGVWLKQRARWMKGYMQTWLVHTRHPFALVRRAGVAGSLAFHLFIGGSVAAALATIPLWLLFAGSLFLPQGAMALPLAGLAGGNLALTALAVLSPVRRGWSDLSPLGLSVALYWTMISLAAFRALWQLATRPFHWEKTAHGLSRRSG